eukprot:5832816-Amphidinium_carterae.1
MPPGLLGSTIAQRFGAPAGSGLAFGRAGSPPTCTPAAAGEFLLWSIATFSAYTHLAACISSGAYNVKVLPRVRSRRPDPSLALSSSADTSSEKCKGWDTFF